MINSNNTLRVTGLASGMNTDEIVANLVKVQSARLNKLQQNKITTTWKQDAYRDVNKKLDEFRKAMEGLRLQSTFNKQTVTSSDPRIEVASAGTSTLTDFVISEATPAEAAKPATVSFASESSSVGAAGLSFTLNNIDITLDPNLTFDQAVAKINEKSSQTNVKAENVGGSLVFTTLTTGSAQKIDIAITDTNSPLKIDNTTNITGTDEKSGTVTINGTQIAVSSNKFTYQGVSFNLKEKIPANSTISVRVSSDTQGIFDTVKTFVDKYNELIADLNGRLTEKRYRDYPPLLDDQKKDMKDNDIKLWDEKAKSGLLTSDSTIRSFLTEMRNSLVTSVQNPALSTAFKSLKDIGIDFSTNYRENGKLVLNEEKLKGVLQTNLEDVKKLFSTKGTGATSSSTTVTDTNMHDNSGFGWRIYDRINSTISDLGSLAGSPNSLVDTKSSIAKQLKSLDENIDREQDKVNSYEQRLWKQFGRYGKGNTAAEFTGILAVTTTRNVNYLFL
ncbi:flagellar hook-associated protein 2 [Bacillus sp. SORGH_AS 510]|uniref:flagellar filament capping protein FliD n=1 Tax=Bacillus sp. SORGH_AS_0510 TaxID=3041771 RepID=UPI00277E507C|nr:flagellar filament capping protein FliD [Bacillus sp. SORGH_AS_0510]MDQ1146301.1 flagellar hook-associated protein 2 [Bacillus sp. SORGH_AS_0510]